jgi:hypothetical protein
VSATTLDVIVDRVRSLCQATPFNYVESRKFDSFDLQPVGAFDGVFRVESQSQQPRGFMNYAEECTDLLTVTVSKATNNDYDGTRRALLKASRSITAAVVRDGAQTSGLYNVPDQGRTWNVIPTPTGAYCELRLTLPVNYEASL